MNVDLHMTPQYAVVIVAYQKDQATIRLLDKILQIKQKTPVIVEVCIIHNGGCLAAKAKYQQEQYANEVLWYEAQMNVGASQGRNIGVQLTRSPWIVFLDDDGMVDDHFFEALTQIISEKQDLMAVRGRVLALNHPWISSIATHYDRGNQICADLLIIEGASSIKREIYEAVGGYDPSIFGNEGIELSYRMRCQFPALQIYYCPSMIFHHDFASGLMALWQKSKRMVLSKQQHEIKLRPALQAYREMNILDQRLFFQKIQSWLMKKIYQLMIWIRNR